MTEKIVKKEVRIQINYSSLNFKDVIKDLNLFNIFLFGIENSHRFELFGEILEYGYTSLSKGDYVVG